MIDSIDTYIHKRSEWKGRLLFFFFGWMIYFSDRIFFWSFLFPLFVLVFAISLSDRKDKPENELTQVRIKDVVRIATNKSNGIKV
jgi:hypothetical protein